MKAPLSLFLIIFFAMVSLVSLAGHPDQADVESASEKVQSYCYRPGKPLFFATSDTKARYHEDLREYENCRQGFLEMQAHVTHMRHESEKNARQVRENFYNKHF